MMVKPPVAETVVEDDEDLEEIYELTIPEPIVTDLFEPDLASIEDDDLFVPAKHPTADNTTFEQRQRMKAYALEQGFDKRCVVVRRSESPLCRTDPECWGFVIAVISYCYGVDGNYAPIRCSWLDGSTTYHFPSELIVVNYPPDDIDLGMISRGE